MIDWTFIGKLEGFRLIGYVPDPRGSNSGVTVACGVDLGQLGQSELAQLPASLQAKLKPYIGLRGFSAQAALDKWGLRLLYSEAVDINNVAHAETLKQIRAHCDFDTMSPRMQTVVASVTFQYGTPWKRCPHFWVAAQAKNQNVMIWILEHFGDSYKTRRQEEADYLAGKI